MHLPERQDRRIGDSPRDEAVQSLASVSLERRLTLGRDLNRKVAQWLVDHPGFVEGIERFFAMLRSETDWRSFSSSLGTLYKNKPGALERRLSKKGDVRIRFLGPEDGEENARLVDWMFHCKRQWADRVDKKGAWLYSMEYRNFLVALLNQTDGEVIARLVVVSLDGAPLAVNILGLGKTCVDDLIGGFDPAYSRQSPGAIATEHCVKWALEHQLDLDCGAGSEKYKGYWSRNHILTMWSMQIANTRWGLLAFQGENLRRLFRWQPPVDKTEESLAAV